MSARTTALCALIATRRQGAWSDGILKEYVQRDRLERLDAALAATLTYGVMQNRMLLDHYLEQVVSGGLSRLQPAMLDILRLGAYQILLLDKIPDSAAVNEAVEQTKRYVNQKAAGMTNGAEKGEPQRAPGPRDKIQPPAGACRALDAKRRGESDRTLLAGGQRARADVLADKSAVIRP